MSKIILVLVYRAYFLMAAIFILNAVAGLMFGDVRRKRIKATIRAIMAAFFFPLFIFSPNGRKTLFNQIDKL